MRNFWLIGLVVLMWSSGCVVSHQGIEEQERNARKKLDKVKGISIVKFLDKTGLDPTQVLDLGGDGVRYTFYPFEDSIRSSTILLWDYRRYYKYHLYVNEDREIFKTQLTFVEELREPNMEAAIITLLVSTALIVILEYGEELNSEFTRDW